MTKKKPRGYNEYVNVPQQILQPYSWNAVAPGGYDGIGRHARFRFLWETVRVRVPYSAFKTWSGDFIPGHVFGYMFFRL